MHRPNFAMRLIAAVTGLLAGARWTGDDGMRVGVKARKNGPSSPVGGRASFACGPRIAFTSRRGKTIVREMQAGSEHERRLLKRRGARRV